MTEPAGKPDFGTWEQRWQAVAQRDLGARGAFVYAVATTGIYCLPGCSSRLPRRQNVEFFDDPGQAEKAGYRPCQRCNPRDPLVQGQADPRVLKACELIRRAGHPPTLAELAEAVNLSRHHLQRLFKAQTGLSPREFAESLRRERLQSGLESGQSVTQALYDAGYGSASRLYENAAQKLGMTPGELKRGGQGLAIHYGSAPCSLGRVLVAATERGICAIELGGSEADALASLKRRFPRAGLTPAGPDFNGLLHRVARFLDRDDQKLDLPLDIQGTAFQRQVWKALQEIPPGGRATYGELAKRLGNPAASRAVAGAVAKNPLAVLIPCHRVLRSDGGLGGYRWGLERKRKILESETAQSGKAD